MGSLSLLQPFSMKVFLAFLHLECMFVRLSFPALCKLSVRILCRFCAHAQNTLKKKKNLFNFVSRISKEMHSNGRDPTTLEALFLILSYNLRSERLGPWFWGNTFSLWSIRMSMGYVVRSPQN